ncbi:MAG: hypothetical protein R3Y56_08500 [Akkermansia sp.]
MNTPTTVTGLWLGERLPFLAELCMRSYLKHGIQFRLFTYQAYDNIPQGVMVEDASSVIAKDDIFKTSTGSYAPFADHFRNTWLYENGGVWTDLDVLCLSPHIPTGETPWFAMQDSNLAAVGLIAFPKGHPVIGTMKLLSDDPANAAPWDDNSVKQYKKWQKLCNPDSRQRRKDARWGDFGPEGFTQALKYHQLLTQGEDSSVLYPIHYTAWRHCYDGSVWLQDKLLSKAIAIHVWNEMFSQEPYEPCDIHPKSIVGQLIRELMPHIINIPIPIPQLPQLLHQAKPRTHSDKKPKILVGICSCAKAKDRRDAVRETWMRVNPSDSALMECLFYIGQSPDAVEEEKLIQLPARDSYEALPEKVLAFFKYALHYHNFDYLFKCDDDTYIDLARLPELCDIDANFIGNPWLASRKAPSGGAGYMLSREMVEKIVADENNIPRLGAEDLIFGEVALRLGAKQHATPRLNYTPSPFPHWDNDLITAHWLSPNMLRAIHSVKHQAVQRSYAAFHPHWQDVLQLLDNGIFYRAQEKSMGKWSISPSNQLELNWFAWPCERLDPIEQGYRAGDFYLLEQAVELLPTRAPVCIAIIPAKEKSQRCHNKNTRLFCGTPLFMHAVNYALAEGITPIVSTDSDDIMQHCKKHDIQVVPETVNDSNMSYCVNNVLHHVDCDYYAILQPSSPLREPGMLNKMFEQSIANNGETIISTQDIKLVGFIDNQFHKAYRDQDSKSRFLFYDGNIFVSSRREFNIRQDMFSPNITYYPSRFPCHLQIDYEHEWNALEALAQQNSFRHFLPKTKTHRVCIISNKEDIDRDYSAFVDSCDIVVRVNKMGNLSSGLTGSKTDLAVVSCWRHYMSFSREDRHLEHLKQVPAIAFLTDDTPLTRRFVEAESLERWCYIAPSVDAATQRFSTLTKAIALADYYYPDSQLYYLGDLEVALRTNNSVKHTRSGDNAYLKRLIKQKRLIPIMQEEEAGCTRYSQEIDEQKAIDLEAWYLKKHQHLDRFETVRVTHTHWNDQVYLGHKYAKRRSRHHLAQVERCGEDCFKLIWGIWPDEVFIRSESGIYELASSSKTK